jgi:hypothetical protein
MTGGRVFMTDGVALFSDVKAMVIRANFMEFTPDMIRMASTTSAISGSGS